MEESYLVSASENILLEHGRSLDNCRTTELQKLVILNLSKQLLKEVEVLDSCSALRSCTLANNYLIDIAALRNCVQIVTLDLHGNQIQNLPDQEFWRQLKSLKLLYLHDNRIRSADNIESLSSCPNLAGVTLYDTPLSLQKSYRHIVVNSIWSLKALDNFVVSDEEIIEDWKLGGRFKALSPELHINMLPVSSKDFSLENEMKAADEIIREINRVLATCSPVLIVQKWIRGYLVRRRLGFIPQLEMKRMKLHYWRRGRQERRASPPVKAVVRQNFRDLPLNRGRLPVIIQPVRRVNSAPDLQPVRHITVDLWKLQQDVLQQASPEAEIVYDLGNQNQQLPPPPISEALHGEKRAKDVKLAASKRRDQGTLEPDQKSDTEFGVFGRKVIVYASDPSKDVTISIEKSAEDIRCSIQHIHSAIQAKREAAKLIDRPRTRPSAGGKHLMKLLPLCAVDKAYENREKYDSLMKNRNLVMKMQDDRKRAKCNIEEFLGSKTKGAIEQHAMDSLTTQQQAQGNILDNSNFMDKVKYRHRQFCKQKEAKRSEHLLAKEFNLHHLSVAKTLIRHDRMIRSQEEMKEKIGQVQALKEDHKRQKEFTKCIQEHRQLVLQIENASEKVTLGSAVLQKANDRLHEARARVTTMKGQRVTTEPMYKVPVKQPLSKGIQIKHGCT
ncbi:leucine-rich repeat and IQ domain-containing protein 3 [Phyllobates terribilis]|uniref:leucine-rich repeat and IQ domain-containing protein 3 n=1 Tax=Phyllobates terribilis TaxID=111132 RepID=UPI003CCAA950